MKNWKGTKKKPFKVVEMENDRLAIANTEMFPTYAAHVYFNDEEGIANANLICEAFNVVNECGLTPRQLAEQNKELLEACKNAINILDLWGVSQHVTISENYLGEMEALYKMEQQLKAAIKNAETI